MSGYGFVKKPLLTLDDGSKVLDPEFINNTTVELYPIDGAANEAALEACITTPRLLLFSAGHTSRDNTFDTKNLVSMYGNPDNMRLFASGKPIPAETVIARHTERCSRWAVGNPFSSFIIETKDGQKTVGQTVFGASGKPGISECAIIIDSPHQRNGYGTEALTSQTYLWAPFLAERGYEVGGAQLTQITATAHPDNGTAKIFPLIGYHHNKSMLHTQYDAIRNQYTLPVAEATEIVERTRVLFKL